MNAADKKTVADHSSSKSAGDDSTDKNSTDKELKQLSRNTTSLWLLVLLLLTLISYTNLKQLDDHWLDTLVKHQAVDQLPDPSIIIIDIDDYSINEMESQLGRWPWPRAVHGELVEALLLQNPKAIVFDILFSETDRFNPDSDSYFSEVVSSSEKVFLPSLLMPHGQAPDYPLSKLSETGYARVMQPNYNKSSQAPLLLPYIVENQYWRTGLINFKEDEDGIGRRYSLFWPWDGWQIDSLAVSVAKTVNDSHLADLDKKQSIYLHWNSPYRFSYPTLSYSDAYTQLSVGDVEDNFFNDKIIIIGSTASGLHDLRATPIEHSHPAIFIIATAVDNLINGVWYHALSDSLILLIIATPLLLLFVLQIQGTSLNRLLLYVIVLSGVLLALSLLAVQWRWLLPPLSSITAMWVFFLGLALLHYRQVQREKLLTQTLFSRFLDGRVVNSLVKQGVNQHNLPSESRHLTLLFSDIRNFTTLSEQHDAKEVVELLNDYFSRQLEVIFSHGGTLDKFIGDAIMAFWGAPVEQDDQAVSAVNAALDMVDKLESFRLARGLPDFDIGIGIHSGEAVVGMIGSHRRYDYTVIGDTVNLSSRLEGLTKGRARILISKTTRDLCGDRFNYRDLGEFQVKGRSEAVHVYEPSRK